MAFVITKYGSFWKASNDVYNNTISITVGLYNDNDDQIAKQHDLNKINEPSDGNYARQTVNLELAEGTGISKIRNAAEVNFDLTNTTQTANGSPDVNGVFVMANFSYYGETAADHLIATFRAKNSEGTVTLTLADETEFPIPAGMLNFGS